MELQIEEKSVLRADSTWDEFRIETMLDATGKAMNRRVYQNEVLVQESTFVRVPYDPSLDT